MEKLVKLRMAVRIVRRFEQWQKYVVQDVLKVGHQFVQLEDITVQRDDSD